MARENFYNANRNRAFPFLLGAIGSPTASADTVEGMPFAAIVDAGFMPGLQASFVVGQHNVWLQKVSRTGSLFTFTFQSDAPGLYRRPLVFTRLLTDSDYTTEFIDDTVLPYYPDDMNSQSYLSDQSSYSGYSLSECADEPLWSGYLVTGRMSMLATYLADGHTLTRSTGGVIEPALIQNLAESYVASVNVANQDRTRATAPLDCPPIVWPYPIDIVQPAATCLHGSIRFSAGYNATVQQDTLNNAIILGASVGAGLGQPCTELQLFPDEIPPEGSELLEGGPRCNDVLRSINGLGGQFPTLLSGPGVTMTPVPETNTLIVDVNMNQLAICLTASDLSQVSESL